ncbi:MAG: hypothetical protein H0T41_05835 [Rhodobacteraceae bacterium]|nr:hypothetical protein [Paracoccaceae bacterium]
MDVETQLNGTTWTIANTFEPEGSASIDYPSILYGGALTLLAASERQIRLKERITRNPGRCAQDGTVVLTDTGYG